MKSYWKLIIYDNTWSKLRRSLLIFCLISNRLLLCWNCKYQYDRSLLSRILLPRGSEQCHTPGLQLHYGSLLPCWVRPACALLCWVIPGQYWVHLLSSMSSWKVHSILYFSFVNWYYFSAKRIKLLIKDTTKTS